MRQITSGEYVGTGIESVDEKTRTLYFNAAGREAGEDPYFTHLYSVNIDTGDDQAAQSRQRVARRRR